MVQPGWRLRAKLEFRSVGRNGSVCRYAWTFCSGWCSPDGGYGPNWNSEVWGGMGQFADTLGRSAQDGAARMAATGQIGIPKCGEEWVSLPIRLDVLLRMVQPGWRLRAKLEFRSVGRNGSVCRY